MISVVLAHPLQLFRDSLARLFRQQDDLDPIGEPGDGETALGLIERLQPRVAVVAAAMPGRSGLEIAHAIHLRGMPTQLILLCDGAATDAQHHPGVSARAFASEGADQLLRIVRATALGDALDRMPPMPPSELSPRERDTLRLLALGHANKAIAAQLGLSTRTVDSYRAQLMVKLGIDNLAGLVKYALRNQLTTLDL